MPPFLAELLDSNSECVWPAARAYGIIKSFVFVLRANSHVPEVFTPNGCELYTSTCRWYTAKTHVRLAMNLGALSGVHDSA